jgi:hypothetical protein
MAPVRTGAIETDRENTPRHLNAICSDEWRKSSNIGIGADEFPVT